MSSQNFVTTPISVFSDRRFSAAGYSTRMNFVYDKKIAKRGRLKEWDFYQILCGDFVLQLVMGHKTSVGQISATLFNIKTGERKIFSHRVLNVRKLRKTLDDNPEKPHLVQWFCKAANMQFEVTQRYRRLTLSQVKNGDIRTEIDVTLTNSAFTKEKAVVAIPFSKPKQWFINYKENCFVANGYARIEGMETDIRNGVALLNWGRGVLPRKYGWVWANGSVTVDGIPFGFNFGGGFGDTSAGTENMFFFDNKAYKLGEIHEEQVGDTFRYFDDEKSFVFEAKPIYDNFTQQRFLIGHNSYHQVFGEWKGFVKLPDGIKIEVPPFVAFCEKANSNR